MSKNVEKEGGPATVILLDYWGPNESRLCYEEEETKIGYLV